MTSQLSGMPPETLRNFRDLGGLRTADGRSVRHATLYRSDAPRPDDAHATFFAGHQIRSVIDLRADKETQGNAMLGDVTTHRVGLVDPTLALLRQGGTVPPQHESYLSMIEANPGAIATIATAASQLPKPLLIHCTAGKDRTGVVVGLLLSAVGVRADDLARDYAASAEAALYYREQLPAAFKDFNFPEELFECRPETMLDLLDSLDRRHGGAREFLLRNGVSAQEIQTLESALLVETPADAPVTEERPG